MFWKKAAGLFSCPGSSGRDWGRGRDRLYIEVGKPPGGGERRGVARLSSVCKAYDAGEYKVLAIVRYQDKDYYSKIYTIKINPAEMTEEYDFTVDIIEYSNEYTGLTGYQFSIDVQQHFLNNQIVWFVRDDTGTSRRQTGFTFNFQPTEIKNYVIN